ncbi:metal-dependent hydrolase [Carboxylicivirga sp. RSCT41]|uniref:metal-dependent hydrolase n=1 Tax=Carboxylicivirga agarovorans TaxID=3417570 RepID=UPI003D340B48
MDILTHTLSGVAIGTVVSAFADAGIKQRFSIVLLSGFAAALPDVDAISLWSGFDSTIGTLFNLPHSGSHIYFAKYWYSHHAFLHSAVAAIMFTVLIGIMAYLIDSSLKGFRKMSVAASIQKNRLLLLGSFLSFILHLVEDMPTPASTWGGVDLLWPSGSYIGGTGDIWWWNNYDIFLIVVAVIVINLTLLLLGKVISFDIRKFTVGVFILGFSFAFLQIKTRDFDFAYTGHTAQYDQYEAKSKQIQRELLGDRIYELMERFDKQLKIYF